MSLKLQFQKKKISPAPAATNHHSISSSTRKPQKQSRCENSYLGRGSKTSVSQPAATSLNYKLLEFKIMPGTCLDSSRSLSASFVVVVYLVVCFFFFLLNKDLYVWGWGSPCIPKFENGLIATMQCGCLAQNHFLCSLEAMGRAQFIVVGK